MFLVDINKSGWCVYFSEVSIQKATELYVLSFIGDYSQHKFTDYFLIMVVSLKKSIYKKIEIVNP